MSYRNILVHLDALPACRYRTDAALELGTRFEARMVGLATLGRVFQQPAIS